MGSLSLIECARFIFGESESVEVRFFRCRADFSDPGSLSLVVWEMVLVLFGESWWWVRREESRESRQEGRQGRKEKAIDGGLRVYGDRRKVKTNRITGLGEGGGSG
jgi:hypothetical protein